jgi:serine/threonine protein kinase
MAITTEQLVQRLIQCGLITNAQVNELFNQMGSREVAPEEFQTHLLRNELVTNYQLERILQKHTSGFFYGEYKLLYIVGAGTFARVYRAVHRETGEIRAVKVLRSRYTSDSEQTERFMTEARMVMKLRHPNIVPIHDVGTEGHRLYMVMDFVEGQNLRDYVSIHGQLNVMTALNIGRDIIAGLDYAFQKGICHRDLKLSNILLSSKGRAMIVDFGLAAVEDKKGETGFNPRSIDYAALEKATQVNRDDKRSDIFFWGCMLYHMIAGRSPMAEARDRSQRLSVSRFTDIKPINELIPQVPHRIAVLLYRAMAMNPKERLQTPGLALREINGVIEAIEAGDTSALDEKLAAKQYESVKDIVPEIPEGESYTLMLIESHLGIQNALRDALKKLGYKVLIFNNPRRALLRFQDRNPDGTPIADCVLFGCGQIGIDCLEAFNYFAEQEYSRDVPAILMTDEKQKHFKARAKLDKHRGHLEMPIKFRTMRAMLRKLLGIRQQSNKESD